DLIQEPAQNRDAFPEITRTERALLLGAAALEIDAPHRRRAVLTRALVELTRLDRETLRECRRIMRVCRDNLEPRDCGSAVRAELRPGHDADGRCRGNEDREPQEIPSG